MPSDFPGKGVGPPPTPLGCRVDGLLSLESLYVLDLEPSGGPEKSWDPRFLGLFLGCPSFCFGGQKLKFPRFSFEKKKKQSYHASRWSFGA